jgi:hypothetical protein
MRSVVDRERIRFGDGSGNVSVAGTATGFEVRPGPHMAFFWPEASNCLR